MVILVSSQQFTPPSGAPPWIVSPDPPPPGSRPPDRSALLAAAGAAIAVLLVLGGAGAWWLLHPAGDTATAAPVAAGSPPPTSKDANDDAGKDADGDGGAGSFTAPPGEAIPDPPAYRAPAGTVDPEAAALGRLDAIARRDLAGIVLDGRYVAQLASKNPGIHDPLQTTADGSHTFRATDILAEHERLRGDKANGAADVVLLRSDAYGKRQLHNGAPLYVTFALGDFSAAADVRAWCAARFPDLNRTARDNQCAVRRLRSPA